MAKTIRNIVPNSLAVQKRSKTNKNDQDRNTNEQNTTLHFLGFFKGSEEIILYPGLCHVTWKNNLATV